LRNRAGAGIILSLLLHAALFWMLRASLDNNEPPPSAPSPPLQISLVQNPRPTVPKSAEPAKPVVQPHPKSQPRQPPRQPPRPRAPAPAPSSNRANVPRSPSPTAVTQAAPEMDMSTMLDAARARRHATNDAAESEAAQENAAARAAEAGPSDNDIARANIAFQERRANGATNGVFEITSKGPRVATYVFRGWTTDARRSRAQTFTVDAGMGGDVEKAIIDDMIRVIRLYYKADFNWNSVRLGHVVTLSARQEDTAGLRAFLMREIFG